MNKIYSVVDLDDNVYAQHSLEDKAKESLEDLTIFFPTLSFFVTDKFNWNEGNKNFPDCVQSFSISHEIEI